MTISEQCSCMRGQRLLIVGKSVYRKKRESKTGLLAEDITDLHFGMAKLWYGTPAIRALMNDAWSCATIGTRKLLNEKPAEKQ